jgi:hypothetical protein
LDSGLDEKVRLASQGNENVLLVSYKELRNYLETSFAYLRKEMEGDLKPNVGYSLPYTSEAGMSGR